MAKKAKAKKAKAPKKKKAAKKAARIVPLTLSGLRRLGAKGMQSSARARVASDAAPMRSAGTPDPNEGSAVIVPGMNGSTLVCFFNPNTGNFDICHTVAGSLGLAKI